MKGIVKSYDKDFDTSPKTIDNGDDSIAYDVVVVPKATNSGTLFIGSTSSCAFPIPSAGMSLGDLTVLGGGEQRWSLEDIMIKSTEASGDGAHFLIVGVKS